MVEVSDSEVHNPFPLPPISKKKERKKERKKKKQTNKIYVYVYVMLSRRFISRTTQQSGRFGRRGKLGIRIDDDQRSGCR